MSRIGALLRWLALGAAVVVGAIVGVRGWQALRDPALAPWHSFVPPEAEAAELDRMDWTGWLAAEDAAFAAVAAEVTAKLAPEHRVPENRYFDGSPMHAPRFATDWNRSFVLVPEGPPRGVAVLVHGLTDGPYSLRHVAEIYRAGGFVAVVPRMPGHGTVPGGLSRAVWTDWMAALRLAVREASGRSDGPLHLVGYSNGGALVTKYALEALGDPDLAQPAQIVLISPMIGVTGFARFAGIAGWPAVLPAFVRAAWFDLIPEFNPFKYNSFPVQAAVQTHRVTRALRADLAARSRSGAIARMPPVLTFQSVVDATVSTRAVIDVLYARLPANGSELVLMDVNRAAGLGPLIGEGASGALARLLPAGPRAYAVTVVGNAGPATRAAAARIEPAGSGTPQVVPLGMDFPRGVFSLSHVALPFPVSDGLYGLAPDPGEDFGIAIGALSSRGEAGVLTVGADMFARLYSNPFFDVMAQRIAATLEDSE